MKIMKKNKMLNPKVIVFGSLLLWAFGATTSYAVMVGVSGSGVEVGASASMDWDSLSFGSGVSVYPDSSPYSWSRARSINTWEAGGAYDSDSKNAITDTSASSVTGALPIGGASATGSTSGSGSLTIATGSTTVAGISGEQFYAEGKAQRGQVFYVNTTGAISFDISYNIKGMNVLADNGYAWGYNRAWSQLSFWNGTSGKWELIGSPLAYVQNSGLIDHESYYMAAVDDVLALDYGAATAGQYLLFEAGVDSQTSALNDTPVPIPAAAWMLGAGLCGLMSLRKKRQV